MVNSTIGIEIIEREGTNHLVLIRSAMNRHLQRIKQANPRGFLDQFDSQTPDLCIQVAQELGGTVQEREDGTFVFNFASASIS
jgi:hypothetical protein